MEQAGDIPTDSAIPWPVSRKRLVVCRLLRKLSEDTTHKEMVERCREFLNHDFVSHDSGLYASENIVWKLFERFSIPVKDELVELARELLKEDTILTLTTAESQLRSLDFWSDFGGIGGLRMAPDNSVDDDLTTWDLGWKTAKQFDSTCSVIAELLRKGKTLPGDVAAFAADVLEGKRKRPTASRGRPRETIRDNRICHAAETLCDEFDLPLYDKAGTSKRLTVAEVIAEASRTPLGVVTQVIQDNEIKKFDDFEGEKLA